MKNFILVEAEEGDVTFHDSLKDVEKYIESESKKHDISAESIIQDCRLFHCQKEVEFDFHIETKIQLSFKEKDPTLVGN